MTAGCRAHRYGYQTAEYYTYVIQQYAQANIPLETFVADSQYMDRDQIWTLGSNFSTSEVKVCSSCSTWSSTHGSSALSN